MPGSRLFVSPVVSARAPGRVSSGPQGYPVMQDPAYRFLSAERRLSFSTTFRGNAGHSIRRKAMKGTPREESRTMKGLGSWRGPQGRCWCRRPDPVT